MSLVKRFVNREEFGSYEEFYREFKIIIPENFNFGYDVVDAYAAAEPERRALVWCDDHGGERIISFGELKRLSDAAAQFLQDAGIRKGDCVMLLMGGRYEFWIAMVALHKLGALAIPGSHMLKAHDLEYRYRLGDIRLVLCNDREDLREEVAAAAATPGLPIVPKLVTLHGAPKGWLALHDALDEPGLSRLAGRFARPTGEQATRNGDPMLAYFTSGTSGEPKLTMHNFVYPLGHITTARYWQNVEDGGLHYTLADTGWAKTAWGKLYGQWIAGTAIFVHDYERFNAQRTMEVCAKYKVTTFCAPMTVYRYLAKEDLSEYDFSSIHHAAMAGEPLNAAVYQRFGAATGLRLMEGFGQSESCVIMANFLWMEPKPGSVGRGSPVFRPCLLKDDGTLAEEGETGELVLPMDRGAPPGLTIGYYKNPEATTEVFRDGYYHTGDLCWRDADGYFWFVGRNDDIIKSSGYRVGPFEVESALVAHPAVLEAAVTGLPDPDRGQIVKATVVLARGFSPSEALVKELQDFVKKETAPYKYPRRIEFVDELPKTTSGKIQRKEIRKRDLERLHAEAMKAAAEEVGK